MRWHKLRNGINWSGVVKAKKGVQQTGIKKVRAVLLVLNV